MNKGMIRKIAGVELDLYDQFPLFPNRSQAEIVVTHICDV